MLTIPAALAALAAFGGTVLGALGPAAALVAGVPPVAAGLGAAGVGLGSVLAGGAAAAGAASNPYTLQGVQAAAADAYNNAALGSSNILDIVPIPGVPQMLPR